MNPIQEAQRLGQEIWLDYIRRGLLKSGELQKLVDTGTSGLTANPTILEKAILGSTDYDPALPGFVQGWELGGKEKRLRCYSPRSHPASPAALD